MRIPFTASLGRLFPFRLPLSTCDHAHSAPATLKALFHVKHGLTEHPVHRLAVLPVREPVKGLRAAAIWLTGKGTEEISSAHYPGMSAALFHVKRLGRA